MISQRTLLCLFVLAVALTLTPGLEAQLNRGTIEGIVTDPQGAVVPGVDVVVTSVDTQVAVTAKTNATGYFRVVDLVPGNYDARFTMSGFTPLDMTGIAVTAGVIARVEAHLQIGQTRQAVEVKSEVPLIETDAENFSTTVENREIQEVPLQGRDLMQLIFLSPGVNSTGGPPGSNFGFSSQFGTFPDPTNVVGSQLSVNGGQPGANAWYLDGNLNLSTFAENVALNPTPDAVGEFQAITNAFSAEYSRTGGAVFNVVLKSGTNNLHGDIYEYTRQSALNARNPFTSIDQFGNIIKSHQIFYNNFGGTLGGPVVIPKLYNGRNKTFFFFSWDARVLHEYGQQTYTVPTALMRQGDFSEVPNAAQYGIWDPYSTVGPNPTTGLFDRTAFGTPVPGNPYGANGCLASSVSNSSTPTCNFATKIPTARLNPIAMDFMNTYPMPNFNSPISSCPMGSGGYLICDNYLGAVGTSQVMQNISIKVDHEWSSKSRWFFEWLYNPTSYTNYRVPWTGPTYPFSQTGFGSKVPLTVHNQIAGVGNTYAFTPNLINEFHYNFSRSFMNSLSATDSFAKQKAGLNQVTQWIAPVQIPVNDTSPTPEFSIAMPVQGLTGGLDFGIPSWENENNMSEAHTILDNVTWIVGRHTFKTGFMYRLDHASYYSDVPTDLIFHGTTTANPVTGLTGGGGLAQFLLGAVTNGIANTADGSFTGLWYGNYARWPYWGFYFQDDFRVSPRLTLNIGLREDMYGWDTFRGYPQNEFCTSCPNSQAGGLPGTLVYLPRNGATYPSDKNNFGPRVNFSFTPTSDRKTVIRGGYDIFTSNVLDAASAPGQAGTTGWENTVNWPLSSNPTVCASYSGQCVAWSLNDTTTNKSLLTFPALNYLPALHRSQDFGVPVSATDIQRPSHDPMIQMWSLEIDRELPGNMMINIGYVGSHGVHLFGETYRQLDHVPLADLIKYKTAIYSNQPISNWYSGAAATALQNIYGSSELPLTILDTPIPAYNGVYPREFDGMSTYNGLNLRIQKKFSHGLNFNISYTDSKKMTNATIATSASMIVDNIHSSGPGGRASYVGTFGQLYQNVDNRKDHLIAVDDIPQMFNTFGSYELPVGAGKTFLNHKGIVNGVFGGWKLTGMLNVESGIPLQISCPSDQLTSRCDLVGQPMFQGSRTKVQREAQWMNPNAFLPPFGGDQTFWSNYDPNDPRAYQFGTAGPTLPGLRSPGFWNVDSALFKEFPIQESKRVEFRWEVFNALNHQNLGIPNTGWCLPPEANGETDVVHQAGCSFGRITNVQTDPRALQFSLKFLW